MDKATFGNVLFVLASLCACLTQRSTVQAQAVYGVARFNMRGIVGTIEFHPLANGSMKIFANMKGFTMKHGWHVHNLPVDTSLPPSMRCGNEFVGPHYDPFNANDNPDYSVDCTPTNQSACEVGDLSGKFGPLTPTTSVVDDNGDLVLYGTYGIIGRSVKIHGTEDVCATVYSSSEMENNRNVAFLQASFIYPFGGTISFRQVEGESAVIFGKIYWVINSDTTMGHNWHVHVNQPSLEYREGDCGDIGGHFNPYDVDISAPSYTMNCSEDITNCEVGDLSGKHGKINILDNTNDYSQEAFLFHDSFLNLTGVNSVVNRSIAIHSLQGPVQGCAPLVTVETLSIATTNKQFQSSQTSRYDQTMIQPHTMYDNSDHRIFSAAIAPNQLCIDVFEAGSSAVFNPHNAPSLDGTTDTPDRYSVGNLTAKYRNIAEGGLVNELPIHGIETVAGHSLGIAYGGSTSSMTYTCRNLRPMYPDGAETKMAKATFNGTVAGAIYFIQRNFSNGVYGTTYITVDIWYQSTSMSRTTGHNWHIHENPPDSSQSCVDSIGGHFNPFNVDITVDSGYPTECNKYSQLRCESGDLSGKHGQMTIDPPSAQRMSYTYTDPNLHLYGPDEYSIIGRSVGLHLPAAQGGSLFDCGAIQEVYEASSQLAVTFPYSEDFDRVEFATMLTRDVDGATPSDILMTDQSMMSSGLDKATYCGVSANLTVLGTSTTDANNKLASVRSQVSSQYPDCSAGSGTLSVLPYLLLVCLVLVMSSLV